MSTYVNTRQLPEIRLIVLGVLAALALGGCGAQSEKQDSKQHNAAVDNTQLGIQYMNQGDLQLAKMKLDRALAEEPGNPNVHSARGMLFERLHELDKADSEFRTALRLAPKDPEVVNNYAVYLCQNGRTDEGVKRFLEAAHNPLYRTPAAAYTNAGVCLRAAKRDDEARADFVSALQARPGDAEATFQLATLEFQHEELAAARTRLDTYMGTYNETPDLLLLGVRVAHAQHDPIAEQRYSRRLKLDFPQSDQAQSLAASGHNPG